MERVAVLTYDLVICKDSNDCLGFGHVMCQNVGNAVPFLEGNSLKLMSSDVKTRF